MSRCPNCRGVLPALQTLCQKCYAEEYAQLGSPKHWWPRIVFRVKARNLRGFLFLFAYCFLLWRFDFPYFHSRHYSTTTNSVVLAALMASVAFFETKKLD